ncbi:MAG TPA: bifunctional 2-polyprenyl-6-hydroxyphenol methylase/3-demethylubiquinol 3-O-methyltransferase UbiG [Burkholderiales bacterium]|nr:bifunctional 2-polyprenyl-6-hydroxyphenol methylase/3-demethylubiquinol 3-O-methyltransferase UbiG [Burkholderiales bacterium]
MTSANIDPAELSKFSASAHHWWDPDSKLYGPLHAINPLRLDFIDRRAALAGKNALDVGCGGGILAEGMAGRGARVTGIDLSEAALEIAKLHLLESGREVAYRHIAAEDLAMEATGRFDVVTCLELLEHVPDPASTVRACAALARPGGHVFFSTINRNPKAYALAVIGAEYLLGLLPRGTHRYEKFIKPSELAAWCRSAGLEVGGIAGMTYNPLTRIYALGADSDVNYLLHCVKEGN